MPGIKILPPEVAQKIAAGEVVERPVSVIKELVENSLDAGAKEIKIELLDGGKKLIRIQDNGCGMGQEDVALCFRRHATSKIEKEEDLEKIATLGFRGEALASISAVSKLTLKTFDGSGDRGYQVEREGDRLLRFLEIALPRGTLVEVRDLFFNLPARRKFLRSERSELNLVVSYLTQAALAFPEVKFSLSHNNREVINCPAVLSLEERVYQLYGKKLLDKLMPVDFEEAGLRVSGLGSRPFSGRFDRKHQLFYVNRRPVKDRVLAAALSQAYLGLMEKQKYPECFLFLEVPYDQVDVNVHPTKAEVRFRESQQVYRLVLRAVEIAARQESLAKPIIVESEEEKERKKGEMAGDLIGKEDQISLNLAEVVAAIGQPSLGMGEPRIKSICEKSAERQKSYQILGQYLNSYIVIASDDGLLIVDQHNAHERVLYDKFRQLDKNNTWAARQMLFPSVLEFSPGQRLSYEEFQDELETVGFRLEPMGGTSFALKEFPDVFQEKEASEILMSILEGAESDRFKDQRSRMLATMACKAAVKAGQPLTKQEMEFLAFELFQTDHPGVCPHGRPVMIKLDRSKIEKTLGRQLNSLP
jgi:DNA mismatch repair protein MutL